MKLPDRINPVHCSSKDGTRYVLNSVSIQGDLAVATDGRSLFAVKGTRHEDDDPVADAEAARIEADREKTAEWLAANPNPTEQ